MLLRHIAWFLCASLLTIGCSSSTSSDGGSSEPSSPQQELAKNGSSSSSSSGSPAAKDGKSPVKEGEAANPQGKPADGPAEDDPNMPITIDPSPATHPEVVYVLMTANNGYGFCTGTLIAADKVITAGHCLQAIFNSWSVVAPNAPGKPRVQVIQKEMYDEAWDEPGHPDLGILKLASPITLPSYAELTDISARLDAKQDTKGVSVVRMMVKPEAPLKKTDPLPISSTADLGYTHGIGVPLFSAGGDSGGGMFLIEKGQMTHKLIGIIREPEPSRQIDHLTKIEPTFGRRPVGCSTFVGMLRRAMLLPTIGVVALALVACGGNNSDANSPRVGGDAGALTRCFANAYSEPPEKKDAAFNDCEAKHFGSEWRKTAHPKEGAPLGTGYLDPEIIRSGISARMRRMKNCYADGLRRDPSLRFEMKVRFTIDTTGHALNVEDVGSHVKDKQTHTCVMNEFTALRFSAPEGGIVSVTYPLLLSPGDTAGD